MKLDELLLAWVASNNLPKPTVTSPQTRMGSNIG